jgi:serine/threonine-protein kinase
MTPAQSELPPWRPDPRSAECIGGRYQLLDDIGQGATSLIYKARDTREDRVVALKVLRASAAGHPRLSAGFRREAEVGARIVHPNVIRIYDSGEHQGWLYLAMEYVNGRTLADILSMSSRLTLPESELLIRQTLAALDQIHSAGIVHRDVKPSNLMSTHTGLWKLMDFGISREQGGDATVGPSLGTPEYMSPERLLGRAATPSSDLYAAAVVCYEAIAGAVPFQHRSPVERCKLPPPSLRDRRPDAPRWLDEWLRRALSPDPANRYPSAAAMLEALAAFEPEAGAAAVTVEAPPAPEPPQPAPNQSIATLLGDEPAPLPDALGLMSESLRCLTNLAASGSPHEPISPHTLCLTSSGRVEIAPHGPTGERDTIMVASPKYSAPELIRGRAPGDTPARADLYALGFVLYEYILGRKLFRAQFPGLDDRGSDLGWMEWHSDSTRKLRSLSSLLPDTPAPLSALFDRLLDKDPAQRPATFDEAYAAVQKLIGRTRQTQQVPVVAATAPSRKPNTILLAIAVAAILVTLLALLTKLL